MWNTFEYEICLFNSKEQFDSFEEQKQWIILNGETSSENQRLWRRIIDTGEKDERSSIICGYHSWTGIQPDLITSVLKASIFNNCSDPAKRNLGKA